MKRKINLKYKLKALEAIPYFYEKYNDIDIYIEDGCFSTKELYKELFKRLIENKIKITKIFSLGTKRNVISNCINSRNKKRKSLYIIDGDINLILKENKINIDNLYILDAYCIENYLIEEIGLIEFLHNNSGRKSREELKRIFKLNNIFKNIFKELMNLYFLFAISSKHMAGLSFIKLNTIRSNNSNDVDLVKLSGAVKFFRTELEGKINKKTIKSDLKKIRIDWLYNQENFFKIVSGKDFLLPITIWKMKEIINRNCAEEIIKIQLIKIIDINRFENLKLKIFNICYKS